MNNTDGPYPAQRPEIFMFNRLSALYIRYAATHLTIRGPGFALVDDMGRRIGNVDLVQIQGNRIRVAGWAIAARVTLRTGPTHTTVRPELLRTDVAAALNIDPAVGFDITIPRVQQAQHDTVLLVQATTETTAALSFGIALPTSRRAGVRLRLRFLGTLARCLPAAISWKRTGDPRHRATIKRLMGMVHVPATQSIDTRLLQPAPAGQRLPVPKAPLTLIMPVYNAFDLLAEALDRIVAHTDLPWRLILIEDGSSDARVRPFLRDWAADQEALHPGRVTLVENVANLGFIGSVNAGLARAVGMGGHVVLLNSDAFVPAGWASRLIAPLLADPGVASVTPMSNDATIFSSPMLCEQTPLDPGMADLVDLTARRHDPLRALAEVPTGMGFCMAMNLDFVRRLPSLDPVFGRGYGEEVDWCQRARALGGRHLGTAALYVEHRGGTSFGSEEKLRLVAQNNALIVRRYPGYDAEVQDFILTDPLAAARLTLALAWAGAWAGTEPVSGSVPAGAEARSVPIYLAHTLGGGADKYLDRRIAEDMTTQGRPAIVLRVGGQLRWQIEVTGPRGMIAGATDDPALVRRLLAPVRRRHVVYSCGVGHDGPLGLPGLLLDLAGKDAAGANIQGSLEILFHDFYPLSPAYTLLDADGVWRGPLTPESLGQRPPGSHALRRRDGTTVTLADWQAAWGPALRAADSLVVFSRDSRAQVLAACPDAASRTVLRPHRLLTDVPRVTGPAPIPGRPARVIGVLGNIGLQKGAGLLVDLGHRLTGNRDLGLVLVGNIDPDYALPPHVPVHGDYAIAEIPALVARYGITDWLIPSIWPETFSYTTHEALATGLPVMAFDLGAQAEAVRSAPNGVILPFGPPEALVAAIIATMSGRRDDARILA